MGCCCFLPVYVVWLTCNVTDLGTSLDLKPDLDMAEQRGGSKLCP